MKKIAFCVILLLSISCVTSCTPPVRHANPFYNVGDDFAMNRIPLIDPIEANRLRSSSPWSIELHPAIWIADFPDNQGFHYPYGRVNELEKFAVKNGTIMAYSSYVDKKANAYIQENYYHWFVTIPDKKITKGFHTEDEFRDYLQTMDVQNPDWQTPDEAFHKFAKTGCLEWIPDCGQQ